MNRLLKSIRRTPYQSFAAFLMLFMSLLMAIILVFSIGSLYGLLSYVETRPQVTVYFQNTASESEIVKIKQELVDSGKALSVKYVSQTEAFKIYKDLNQDNPLLLEMVSADILPASLEINAKKPVYLSQIAEFLQKKPGVNEVVFQKIIIDRLVQLTTLIKTISLAFFIFLAITTMIILFTITHFKVALRKDEIELLRLLGASNNYIRWPFFQESLIFAFFSATSAFLFFISLLLYFSPFINSYLRGIDRLIIDFDWTQITVWPINLTWLVFIYFAIAVLHLCKKSVIPPSFNSFNKRW
ncbi:MAG: permease-like cell division protein FtsX [Candidatus Omnitrophica bacterium]|nr:permease-like cell division protein FtsX [Candidatus Omnitrophota bacterium]